MTATAVDAGDGLPLTVPSLLAERASRRRDHPWLICDDDVLSYGDADTRSAGLAEGLLAVGAGRGTRVGLLHPNGPEFVVGWLAAARIGAITVPLSTLSTGAELRVLLRGADVEVLLAATSFRGRSYVEALVEAVPSLDLSTSPPLLDPAMPALRRVAFAGTGADVAAAWRREALVDAGSTVDDEVLVAAGEAVNPADRLVIVHTSGSTGEPKGVVHQHGPLIRHLDDLNELRRYDEDEVLFSNSPFFWIGGFAYSLLGTLLAGATLVCSNVTEPAAVLDLIEATRPTMVNGFAATVAHLADDPTFAGRDLRSIRRGNLWPIMPAGARPADPGLRHDLLGMTETGSVCLASDDESDQPESRRGSFGRPVPGFESRIVDPDTGADCEVGRVGELWLRSPFLMEGYYGLERHETFTPEGWYRSGDLFHVDADGFHYFTGRRGDMIKTSGANVAPREVESAIADLTGLTAHVVGVDDPERGEVVVAALRVQAGHDAPDLDELRTLLRARLSAYKVPRRFLVLADDEVPVRSSGKLDAGALKAMFR
ncbi:MAG TPA: class I adenylate-forming enzyme family protein [Acidimicrobiales bacterium]|nr:class I adenylate-forming enzyme family protein [Acidimicrobiales bacterium]